MLNDHDQNLIPRCRRLGHEVTFGYCRQEANGNPCRLILDCWWEYFDVRAFLNQHLSTEAMAQVELASNTPPTPKVLSLFDVIQEAKRRIASNQSDGASSSESDIK